MVSIRPVGLSPAPWRVSGEAVQNAMRLFSGCLISVCLVATPARAQTSSFIDGSEFEVSGWAGGAFVEPALGRFDYCRLGRVFDNGVVLSFTMDGGGHIDVGILDESWAREPGTAIPLAARLDDLGPVELVGTADSATSLSVPAGNNPDIVDAFRGGYVFEIVGEDFGPLSFGLTGTSASLSELRRCVAGYREIALTPSLGEDGRRVARALAGYPVDIRRATLDATLYPDVIQSISDLQAASSDAFRELIAAQPSAVQTLVWRVVRYPDLVSATMAGDAVADPAAFPSSATEAAETLVSDHVALLDAVHGVRVEAEQALTQFLRGQPLAVEATFRTLIDYPEIMAGLAANPDLVDRAGQVWASDPEAVWQALDLAIAEIEGGQAAAQADWAARIADNPDAAADLVAATEAYVADRAAADPVYAGINQDPALYANPAYAAQPYPYWYGPPPQAVPYAQPTWYPEPYYQDTGFTLTDAGQLLITGFVTVAFVDWLFDDDDDRWSDYPDLSGNLIINVEDNVIIVGGASDRIDDWRRERAEVLPADWFDNDGRIADRMAELGDFERALRDEEDRLGTRIDHGDFLAQRGDDFPRLSEGDVRGAGLADRQAVSDRGTALTGVPAPAGGERGGIIALLDREPGLPARPADDRALSPVELTRLQPGPNGGPDLLPDRAALDRQLGGSLAERLTGGPSTSGGALLPRDPDRALMDTLNGGQLAGQLGSGLIGNATVSGGQLVGGQPTAGQIGGGQIGGGQIGGGVVGGGLAGGVRPGLSGPQFGGGGLFGGPSPGALPPPTVPGNIGSSLPRGSGGFGGAAVGGGLGGGNLGGGGAGGVGSTGINRPSGGGLAGGGGFQQHFR
ncbi:MAG: hypothetical protein RLO50_02590 [Azospirillaceae bacterium]